MRVIVCGICGIYLRGMRQGKEVAILEGESAYYERLTVISSVIRCLTYVCPYVSYICMSINVPKSWKWSQTRGRLTSDNI